MAAATATHVQQMSGLLEQYKMLISMIQGTDAKKDYTIYGESRLLLLVICYLTLEFVRPDRIINRK